MQDKNTIKMLIMDVDGTMTDGKIYMGVDGEVFKAFDIKDGCGIHDLLPRHDITPIVITARKSQIVENRCKELGIKEFYQGIRDKRGKIQELANQRGYQPKENGKYQQLAYIGDDLIDIPAASVCGTIGCPSNSVDKMQDIADYVCRCAGGDGAIREFIEWIIRNNG